MTIIEFLNERLDYWEQYANGTSGTLKMQILASIEAQRQIVDWHDNWPSLVQDEPEYDFVRSDANQYAISVSQKIQWLTQREYVHKYGSLPPSAPILKMLASAWCDHPDFDHSWLYAPSSLGSSHGQEQAPEG